MASTCGKPQSQPNIVLLKDYLRDDLSSCSSSGFKSLPRRHCCLHPSRSPSFPTKSALHKASEAVLNAIKSLQIGGAVVSRSFSRRLLLCRSFYWTSASKGDYVKPSTFPPATVDSTQIQRSVTTTNTCSSATDSTGDWASTEEKEQFSPVSVLDCQLFDNDDEEEITSPFNSSTCSSLEGAKHKRRVASLKPVALEKRMISWSKLQGVEPIMCDQNVEDDARDFLKHVKRSIPSNYCLRIEAENLLIDFFKQSIVDNDETDNSSLINKRRLCKVAEDWIRGDPQEQYLSWEVREGRELYVKEMEKYCGDWRNSDEEILHCIAMELEFDLFTALVNELLLDLTTC